MRFLEAYRTLSQFKQATPGFGSLAARGEFVFNDLQLCQMLEYNGVNVAVDPAKTSFATLLTTYGEKELHYGLATLWGVGKGTNEITQHRGTYIAKFSGEVQELFISRTNDFFGKLDRVVELTRRVVRATETAFGEQQNPVLEAAMKHHFRLERADPLWATVKQHYTNMRQHLDGIFRLAANKPGRGGAGARGYVIRKTIDEPSSASPYKTAYLKKPNEYGGSIHIHFTTLSSSSDWRELGIAALIVHEASHKICSTEDHAYVSDGDKYVNLSKELRVDNADCYGFTAASVYAGKVFTEKMNEFS